MGQVNFDLGQIKIEVWSPSHAILFPDRTRVAQTLGTRLVVQWAIDHVTLSESVSLVNDNFQTETISKLKTASEWHNKLNMNFVTPAITILVTSSSLSVSDTALKY